VRGDETVAHVFNSHCLASTLSFYIGKENT